MAYIGAADGDGHIAELADQPDDRADGVIHKQRLFALPVEVIIQNPGVFNHLILQIKGFNHRIAGKSLLDAPVEAAQSFLIG